MIAKVKNLKPGMVIVDMDSLIESITQAKEPADPWYGQVFEIKVAQMETSFRTYGEMEFECYWPST